jgi:putative ABC transport system substrate-binding protein
MGAASAARRLDALHVRAPFDAEDGPTVMPPTTPLAARYRLPAVYAFHWFVAAGGLMSYGIEIPELFRRSTTYVDRILKGAVPADLPVQTPVTFKTVINLRTAKALGFTISPTLLVAADEVIE